MLADNPRDVQAGELDPDVHKSSISQLESVFSIADQLLLWRDHDARPTERSETALNGQLCDHLNSAARNSKNWSHIQFRTETPDEVHVGRRIDLTARPCGAVLTINGRRHTQFDALFPIECKRLPTPKEKGRDEREYVISRHGTTGGIQRIKFGFHGAAHKFAAMIAYVQEKTFSHWVTQVNRWILELSEESDSAWTASDTLQSSDAASAVDLCILSSRHQRTGDLGECDLRHLWIKMH